MNSNSKPPPFVFLFSLLTVLLHVSACSPLNGNTSTPFNITRGSSLCASYNETSYWLSPSGIFAFGFYPICLDCNDFTVGIWIHKSYARKLIWTAELDHDDYPIGKSSSILLNQDGVFELQRPGHIAKTLFADTDTLQPRRSLYAMMHDTGNFVLYDSENTIWQSFHHPTNTIISGQSLKYGQTLQSDKSLYKLQFDEDGRLFIDGYHELLTWESGKYRKGRPVALNLDSSGRLYLVDQDGLASQNFTKGLVYSNGRTVYLATLGSDGVFRLYAERMSSDYGETVELWHSDSNDRRAWFAIWVLLGMLFFCPLLGACCIGCIHEYAARKRERQST